MKLLTFVDSLRFYGWTSKKYFRTHCYKFNPNFLNVGNFGSPTNSLKKCASPPITFFLWLDNRNLIDDRQNISFNKIKTWNLTSLHQISNHQERAQFRTGEFFRLRNCIMAMLNDLINPFSDLFNRGTYSNC